LKGEQYVWVRRQWNDDMVAKYRLNDVDKVHWSTSSGGVMAPTPQPFLHGYVWCDAMVEGELAHSGVHGPCPHEIKVCIVRKDNDPDVFQMLQEAAGPKPKRPSCSQQAMRLVEEWRSIRGPELRSQLQSQGYSRMHIGRVLQRLEQKGVLLVRREGRAKIYELPPTITDKVLVQVVQRKC